jgi:hypothetical protein
MSASGLNSGIANSSHSFFYLKSIPHSASPNGKYSNRYVRYTGSGHSEIVLTEAHPVYLKFYYEDSKQLATFKDDVWGFKMNETGSTSDGLQLVEIFKEPIVDRGFYFDGNDGGKLKWKNQNATSTKWEGWVLCESPPDRYKGNPQLFWSTRPPTEMIPTGQEWVDLVAEYI